jgi:hypothetical protein
MACRITPIVERQAPYERSNVKSIAWGKRSKLQDKLIQGLLALWQNLPDSFGCVITSAKAS